MKRLRKTDAGVQRDPKSAGWKVALAAHLKKRLMCTNRRLGERLNLGPPGAVCRYVSEAVRGGRPKPLLFAPPTPLHPDSFGISPKPSKQWRAPLPYTPS